MQLYRFRCFPRYDGRPIDDRARKARKRGGGARKKKGWTQNRDARRIAGSTVITIYNVRGWTLSPVKSERIIQPVVYCVCVCIIRAVSSYRRRRRKQTVLFLVAADAPNLPLYMCTLSTTSLSLRPETVHAAVVQVRYYFAVVLDSQRVGATNVLFSRLFFYIFPRSKVDICSRERLLRFYTSKWCRGIMPADNVQFI